MTVKELEAAAWTRPIATNDQSVEKTIKGVYCCDLLSIAMGRLPAGSAWVTVMGNVNVLAVAALADAACIVLAEGAALDEAAVQKAREQEIAVFCTGLPVFDAALKIYEALHG